MYCKKLVILIVLLSFIPVVSSVEFICDDNTFVGNCNFDNDLCIYERNLLDYNDINLIRGGRYLFFGNGNCEDTLRIGDNVIELFDAGDRFVADFRSLGFNGEIKGSCDNNYLGKVSDDLGLYNDCNYCGKCEGEFLEEEVEVLVEEICADFNLDGEINLEDYFILSDSFGLSEGDEFYNRNIDLDGNGKK